MSPESDAIAANAEFYDAFNRHDIAAMDVLWARRHPVACIHPGWNLLRSREEIMASWEAILTNPGQPRIVAGGAEAIVVGDAAVVICREFVGGAASRDERLRERGGTLADGAPPLGACRYGSDVSLPPRRTFERLDEAAVDAIGHLFRATPQVEPYSPDGTPVYRMAMGGSADGIRLILWPSLNRVDVNSAGTHGWVLKDVGRVEVIDGVEVVFHPREGEGYLFVSVNGFVNMVMG